MAWQKVRCVMEVVHPRCAGIDVSKRDAKVCVRVQGGHGRKTSSTVTTWGAMTNQILALKDYLAEQRVTVAVMESTSDYWRPFYYVLEADFEVLLVNARDVKNVPGRKTDVQTLLGWPTWAPTACSGHRSCRRNRSGNCGT